MPDTQVSAPPAIGLPVVEDTPVPCRKCGHEFQSYMHRTIGGERVLIDRDGDTVWDLVKVCHYCKDVFHWHTSVRQMQEAAIAYQDMFEALMQSLHGPVVKSAPTVKDGEAE